MRGLKQVLKFSPPNNLECGFLLRKVLYFPHNWPTWSSLKTTVNLIIQSTYLSYTADSVMAAVVRSIVD